MVAPLLRELVHSGLKEALLRTRSSSSSPCQYADTFVVAASPVSTFQVSPSALNHWAPACQAIAWKVVGSSGKKVPMRAFLSAFLTFSAASRNSSQVLGTSMPYFSNRSLR